MPWLEDMDDRDDFFGADGLIHTTRQETRSVITGRREIINENTYNDAYVCLTCPLEECEGDQKCFARRKKKLEEEQNEQTNA